MRSRNQEARDGLFFLGLEWHKSSPALVVQGQIFGIAKLKLWGKELIFFNKMFSLNANFEIKFSEQLSSE